jgi:hypothetical protein
VTLPRYQTEKYKETHRLSQAKYRIQRREREAQELQALRNQFATLPLVTYDDNE